MGTPHQPEPVRLFLAAFSRHESALDWARELAEGIWGPIALASERLRFAETDYYTPTMGGPLLKQLLLFQRPFDPGQLAEVKLRTSQWEAAYASAGGHPEARPLNLDPGYLTLAKLVLASTKDHAHRVYVGQGIYAEVTLRYQHGQWQANEWTFPDYRRADYHQFLARCRDCLKR